MHQAFKGIALSLSLLCSPFGMQAWADQVLSLSPGADVAAALRTAKPGTVITLAPGDYGSLNLTQVAGTAEQPLVLRSQDPTKPARLSRMDLREVSHMVLDGLMFDYSFSPEDPGNFRPFQVFTTRDLTIRNAVFDGDIADIGSDEDSGYPTAFGLAIRASSGIMIDNNEFRDFYRGMVITDSVDIAVRRNELHDLRMDGMDFAQVERVLIEDNLIRDFKRAVRSADHSDMIQFWTNGTERPSRDIVIRGNVLNSGLGWFTQSIFMRNDMVDSGRAGGEMFYQNIRIENNVVINAHIHGITVGETTGLAIRNNTVVHNARSDGEDKKHPNKWLPQIRVADAAHDVVIANNLAGSIPDPEGHNDWTVTDNLEIQDQAARRPNFYDEIFIAARTGDPRDLASFRYLPDGPAVAKNLGAAMLRPDAPKLLLSRTAQPPAPAIRALQDDLYPARIHFEAKTGSKLGALATQNARFEWDFGDGKTGTGPAIVHDFAVPGEYKVTLRTTLSDGKPRESTSLVHPRPVEILNYDPAYSKIFSYVEDVPKEIALSDSIGSIHVGGKYPVVSIPATMIAPFFETDRFDFELRVRTDRGYRAAGELFRVHPFFIATIGPRGTIEVHFNTQTANQIKFVTAPTAILSGQWVDLLFRYSNPESRLDVFANGKLVGSVKAAGSLPPLKSAGLSLGNPFNMRQSFDGEIGLLSLKVGEHDPIPRP